MKKIFFLTLSSLALVACDSGNHSYEDGFSEIAEADFSPAPQSTQFRDAVAKSVNGGNVAKPTPPNQTDSADPAGIYLAYRYGYGLIMPAAAVKATTDQHIQICRDAGPKLCQVTGSNTQNYSAENISANLSLRAEPGWLTEFVTGMKADVKAQNGRIENENTSVEDLTRAILDTDARLKAKRSLRTRLEGLLETRDAKLPDLLALERELARVQGEIESATANLKALRARVSMSVVNISYRSEQTAVSRSAFSPIGAALKDFVRTVARGIAGVIRFIAAILPWLIFIIIPGLFALRWFWRRRKLSPKPKQAE